MRMKTSESITKISKAIVDCQAELDNPKNTAVNPYFKSKYAPLNDILNYVKPILRKHGLSIIQDISHDNDRIVVSTMILHESGEYICQTGASAKPDKDTAQGAGSAITYLRRYTISAVLNISSEDDNDGNAPKKTKQEENPFTDSNGNDPFTDHVKDTFDGENDYTTEIKNATEIQQVSAVMNRIAHDKSLDPDDRGHLINTANGKIKELKG